MMDSNTTNESIKLFNFNNIWGHCLIKRPGYFVSYTDFIADTDIPVPILKTKRNSSGYAWRNVELTRKELLCLLLFSQDMNNQQTACASGISTQVVNARSTSLRYKLRFSCRKTMVSAMQKINFENHFSATLINSLFDEIQQKNQK